ncbi:MAG: outer membrane protein assembly factor BamE [Gammaproteobacteria bacterium]
MQKILAVLALTLFLSSCAWVHKIDIEQGNVYTPEMVDRLHPGMSLSQVKEVMGSPMLLNTFADDRVTYIYTMKPGGKPMGEQYVILTFKHGRLQTIDKNLNPAIVN